MRHVRISSDSTRDHDTSNERKRLKSCPKNRETSSPPDICVNVMKFVRRLDEACFARRTEPDHKAEISQQQSKGGGHKCMQLHRNNKNIFARIRRRQTRQQQRGGAGVSSKLNAMRPVTNGRLSVCGRDGALESFLRRVA
ncbi:hypothetical protein BIW11_03637 [Tropilaelaps mercedesae]|uniref:Uncharacterized protein n=1 Tax=Tropilaelaps mercedesae TaxID=418985 RepID=A0A1V9XIA2_9ACAR|nr:hypothetical protein BIW11_03637 [Tropilaelaps mercedesae]